MAGPCLESETLLSSPLGAPKASATLFSLANGETEFGSLIRLSTITSGLWTCAESFCRRQQRESTLDMMRCSSEVDAYCDSLNKHRLISSRISKLCRSSAERAKLLDILCSEIRCSKWLTRSFIDIEGLRVGTLVWSCSISALSSSNLLLLISSILSVSAAEFKYGCLKQIKSTSTWNYVVLLILDRVVLSRERGKKVQFNICICCYVKMRKVVVSVSETTM